MLHSRRSILSTLGIAMGLAGVIRFAPPALAQHPTPPPPQPKASPNAPRNQNAPMGLDGPQLTPQQRQSDLNRQLNADLRTEVEKLCEMANELKEDMVHSNPSETLSLAFIKKAQAIEKLAKQIKDRAKG